MIVVDGAGILNARTSSIASTPDTLEDHLVRIRSRSTGREIAYNVKLEA